MKVLHLSTLCFVWLTLRYVQTSDTASQTVQQGTDIELELQKLRSLLDEHISENTVKQKLILQELQTSRQVIQTQDDKIAALQKELQQQKMLNRLLQEQGFSKKYEHMVHKMTANTHIKRADDNEFDAVISHVTQQLNHVTADVQALQNAQAMLTQNTGTVFTRWGNAACPNSTETVYSGMVGGSWYNSAGSAANSLCLPHGPEFDGHVIPRYGHADLFGAEYETCDEPQCDMTVACAVCRSPRTSLVMIPAVNTCQPGWNLEYSGYLMAGHPSHESASEFICVDRSRGYIESTQGDQNGRLLYYTAVHCKSLSCPPYQEGKVVLCAVCSK